MIFPIGDDQVKGGAKPFWSYTFILLNITIYLYEVFLQGNGQLNEFLYNYGTIPAEIVRGEDYYTLFTNMFLHGGWMHLIGNMLYLWVFADNIEARIGNTRFVLFYIGGGIFASLTHVIFNMDSQITSIGASGALSAVLGAYLVMFPQSKIKLIFIYYLRPFKIAAIYFLGIWIIQQLISGFASLGPETAQTGGTAWWAHIGGFLFGLAYGFIIKRFYLREK
jgi:membrane associated rhomboid family serine protease